MSVLFFVFTDEHVATKKSSRYTFLICLYHLRIVSVSKSLGLADSIAFA